MMTLLYKEIRLAAHPSLFLFLGMGALTLVPAYPYGVVFFFGCLGIFQTFINARENKDAFFTAALPVNKRDVVRAKCQLLAAAQLGQLLLTVPFALLRVVLLPNGNPAGIEANVAYFGCGLLIYAAFNAVFLISFYKTAYKAGKAFLLGVIPVTLGIGVMETLAHVPGVADWFDSTAPAMLLRQLPILAAGLAAYGGGMALTYQTAAARFEKVDLL